MIEHKKNDPKGKKNIKANVSSSFSNRIIFFKQKYLRWASGNRDTGTHFSPFIFRRRTRPTQVACAFSGRPPWVTDPASEHPRGPAGMGLRSSKVPVLGKTSRKNSKCSGTMGVTSLSPGFGLLCAASLGGWFSSVWGCIEGPFTPDECALHVAWGERVCSRESELLRVSSNINHSKSPSSPPLLLFPPREI